MGDGDFVWSGDDSEDRSSSERDDDAGNPFGDLLDRIEGAPRGSGETDDIADMLPSTEAADPGDIERLLERIGRGRTRGLDDLSNASGGADSEADGPGRGTESSGAPSKDDLPGDGTAEAEGDPPSAAESPSTEPGGRFDDLLDRVDREAGGRQGASGPSGSLTLPADAGSLPADASGILLLGTADEDDFDACLSILRDTAAPRRTNLLLVWLGRDVSGRLERLYERYADRSTDVTVVCRSKVEKSLRAESAIPADGLEGNLTIERISDPRDLPKLGIAISQAIGNSAGGSTRTVMCFHSITDLLQFASHERVFRFLHVLQGRIDSIEATGYYHIDRDAHEERTVATFWNLFDATIDLAGG